MKRNGNVLLAISAVSYLIAVVLTPFGLLTERLAGARPWVLLLAGAAVAVGILAGLLWTAVTIIIDRQELILDQLAELKRATDAATSAKVEDPLLRV